MKEKTINKISNGLSIFSIASITLAFLILWTFTKESDTLIILTIFAGILVLLNGVAIYLNLCYENKKIKESSQLMNLRMNKAINHSIFYFGIGIPLFYDAFKEGLINQPLKSVISILIVVIGIVIYERDYKRREIILEKFLIKKNKRNLQ